MNKRLARARAEHDRWLEKRGLLPSQIKARRGKPKPLEPWDAKPLPAPRQSMTYTAGVNSIWEKIRKGEEKPETIEAIVAKSKRIAPLFNKGAVQYVGDDPDVIRNAGKKNAS
jgi:hypothetical protein